jgi:drug/metabolite transporter (DMT)-like permease
MTSRTQRWLLCAGIAFFAQTIAPFGLKILAERHLTERYEFQFLLALYLGGLCVAPVVFRQRPLLPFGREFLIGSGMAVCSVSGMAFTGLALAQGVPAYLTFSLTQGGAVFLVVGAGILVFREKLGWNGFIATGLGIIAIVILSMG